MNIWRAVVLGGITVLASVPLLAHHGSPALTYDTSKVTALKGVIKQFDFKNPHCRLFFDVNDEKGNVVTWAAEMRAPENLESIGYTRQKLLAELKPGAQGTFYGNVSKRGTPVMIFIKAELADGYCLCKNPGGGTDVK